MPGEVDAALPGRRHPIARSLVWSGLGSMVFRLGTVLAGIVVARLLTPHDFGLFAIALAVYLVVINISELGVGAAVVREPEADLPRILGTAVTLSVVSSAALAGLLYLSAPALASALGNGDAAVPIRAMSLVVLLGGPAAVPAALLTRAFRQDLKFRADLLFFVFSTAVLLVMAATGGGVMSFAWSRVAGQLVSVVALMVMAPRIRPGFEWGSCRHLLRFGMPLVGANLVGYALTNIDVVVIGRLLTTVALGTYALAFNVASFPQGFLSTMLLSVGLPLLSRIHADQRELLEGYLAVMVKVYCGAFVFVSVMIAALSAPLVDTVYGDQWVASAPVLAVLAVYGIGRLLVVLLTDALVASRRTTHVLWLNVVWAAALAPAMIVGVQHWAVMGAAWAHVAVTFGVAVPLTLVLVRRATGSRVAAILRPSVRPVLVASVVGVVAHTVASLCSSPVLGLVLGGLVGVSLYAATMARWAVRLRHEVRAAAGTTVSAQPAPAAAAASGGAPA